MPADVRSSMRCSRRWRCVRDALDFSRGVLRDFGNMSSATLIFVLQRILRDAAATGEGIGHGLRPRPDRGNLRLPPAMSLAARSTAAERMDTDCADYDDYARCLADLARVNLRHADASADAGLAGARNRRPAILLLARRRLRSRRPAAQHPAMEPAPRHRRDTARHRSQPVEPCVLPGRRPRRRMCDHLAQRRRLRVPAGAAYDFIVSSQFTHHLTDADVVRFIDWMEQHAARGWYIADLHRHWFPYYGFGLLAWAAGWHRFIRYDGRVSIARSFVPAEWRELDAGRRSSIRARRATSTGTCRSAFACRGKAAARDQMHPPVIIGGGPAGAAAAAFIAAAGRPVTLIERNAGPTDKLCGDFLSGGAIAALHDLGIDPLTDGAMPVRTIRLVHRDTAAEAALPFAAAWACRAAAWTRRCCASPYSAAPRSCAVMPCADWNERLRASAAHGGGWAGVRRHGVSRHRQARPARPGTAAACRWIARAEDVFRARPGPARGVARSDRIAAAARRLCRLATGGAGAGGAVHAAARGGVSADRQELGRLAGQPVRGSAMA